ncbi:MAG: DUF4258 domain-containing protein [Anaerolineaceae bacterium]|nr:DUF4258 domain-containing protein [Anaerolineaceae bacterium]
MDIRFSDHAKQRCAQRNLSHDEIQFIIAYGRLERRAGIEFYQLRQKDLPPDLPANDPRHRLVGSTVLLSKNMAQVVTAYRNGRAFRRDRQKSKYDFRCI